MKSQLLHSARITFNQCMGLKSNESVLILSNPLQRDIAGSLYDAALEITKDVTVVFYPPGQLNGEEPPDRVSNLMLQYDVIIAATTFSISHTEARRNSCRIRKARIASMPGITNDIFIRGMAADYNEIEKLSEHLKPFFDKAKTARITSSA